ncbi:methyltransferase domain-containing protein [Angustibacter sp. McL0619]|uniref:methyltransferase domain-containing protein n=1 Tax=Angustibacter sp. McL0619 TaxID=3415676 RepID=UPI003CEA4F56
MPTSIESLFRPDRYPLSSKYDPRWIVDLEMGPNPLWQLEDLLTEMRLRPGQRVLDLGCGKGATSVFLARELGVEVVAFDLWVSEAELRTNLEAAGVAAQVTPVHGTVLDLPFGDGEFDAILSVDAFEYFGTDVHLLPRLLRVLKPAGSLGMSTPALREDPYEAAPPVCVTDLFGWEVAAWHSPGWWARHWTLSGMLDDVTARMQEGGSEDWLIWSRSLEQDQDSPVTRMLEDMGAGIGFALVTGTKTTDVAHSTVKRASSTVIRPAAASIATASTQRAGCSGSPASAIATSSRRRRSASVRLGP